MDNPLENQGPARRNRPFDSLRGWLRHLAATDRMVEIAPKVALRFDLAAIAKKLEGRQASYFPAPDGHAVPVISGVIGARHWIAEAMGVAPSELLAAYRAAADAPLPWREVAPDAAPCRQVVHRAPLDLAALLPLPTHHELDAGAYITAGLVIARNPRTGKQNVSINRLQLQGPDRLGILILPRDLSQFYAAAEQAGQPLDIAIAIGVDPLTLLASQAIVPLDQDELEIAGALHGAPLAVVKALTNAVRVPADAEFVVEGRLLPHVREVEGPFGEFPKYYGPAGQRQVIEVTAVTQRAAPLYHTIVPGGLEHLVLGAIPREATILAYLQRNFANVRDVHLSLGGVARYHLFVKIAKRLENEAFNIIAAAFSSHFDVKHVIVVDDDIDIHDPSQVEWAVATRFQADRDLFVMPRAQGSRLDPSTDDGTGAKMGLDATRPLAAGERYTVMRIPGEDTLALDTVVRGKLDPARLDPPEG